MWNFVGRTLVQDLLYKFLFPSSKLIMESSQHSAEGAFSGFNPKFVAIYMIYTGWAKKTGPV